jgi:hypothetical protein
VTKKLRQTKSHIKSILFHGIKVPDEFDNSNWTISFYCVVRRNKIQHSCGDLAQGKIRMFKFIKSEYLEIANQMRAYCRKTIRKITIF